MALEDLMKIATMGEGAIERQEAEGQQDFVASETLPKDCPREQLEQLGFIFGDDADDIFINVKFPVGWTKKATEHSMHNDLLDDKGRVRGGIFYKAAFYDRHADLHLVKRYVASLNWELREEIESTVKDNATGETIFKSERFSPERGSDEYWRIKDEIEAAAASWLEANFPRHQDATEYWDS